MSEDLVAASATPLILSILHNGDSYGYDIIHQVREFSGGGLEWADGMLYPILHRLEKKQFIEPYWEKAKSGRKRKYYRFNKGGLEELVQQRNNWEKLSLILQNIER